MRIKLGTVKLGPRRIWHAVRDRLKVCITTVYNILVRKGVYALLRPKEEATRYESSRPNEMWHIDIARKTIKGRGKKYIVAVVDGYSRKALACDAYGRKDAGNVCRTVKKAVKAYGAPDAMLSDNGKQFVGRKFRRLMKRLETRHKRTAVRNPKCKGKVGRWIRTLKEECLRIHFFKSMAGMQREMDRYVRHYNSKRMHQGIGDTTPDSRYCQ